VASHRAEIPQRIYYELPTRAPVADVVASLQSINALLQEIGPILEGCVAGLKIEGIEVSLEEISEGSLKEIVWATIFLTFQEDLQMEVPGIVEQLTGYHVSDKYDTVVTVAFCLLLFYGADFLYHQLKGALPSKKVKAQLDGLIADAAAEMNVPEDKLRALLKEKYAKGKIARLMQAAHGFFTPSKHQQNAPIMIGGRKIDRETVEEVPGEIRLIQRAPDTISHTFRDTAIELHAQDLDRPKQGWAAIVPEISKDRVKLEIYPPVTPDQIYTRPSVRGDVIAVYKRQSDDSYKPSALHLIRLSE
jgi:hypothetical protein